MGLIQDYTTPAGLIAEDAYHHISTIHVAIDKDDDENTVVTCYFNVDIYKDQAARESDKPQVGGASFLATLDLSGSKTQYNLVKQGYEVLKSLDEYSGAVDA